RFDRRVVPLDLLGNARKFGSVLLRFGSAFPSRSQALAATPRPSHEHEERHTGEAAGKVVAEAHEELLVGQVVCARGLAAQATGGPRAVPGANWPAVNR